ncbi:hypothetical protein CALVIDRAFT_371116 [Calocera viscosa TUFC12733]|uniref:Uncharacterized protein n=1 Tax=Calocera viscosa (strain TUFC12733) TaxID=1330018 RepID=A0A167GVT4_CALVF|nr:hypothetical protein CALVIDRAFT_371116 [Calocera viscosa TUFC12733]
MPLERSDLEVLRGDENAGSGRGPARVARVGQGDEQAEGARERKEGQSTGNGKRNGGRCLVWSCSPSRNHVAALRWTTTSRTTTRARTTLSTYKPNPPPAVPTCINPTHHPGSDFLHGDPLPVDEADAPSLLPADITHPAATHFQPHPLSIPTMEGDIQAGRSSFPPTRDWVGERLRLRMQGSWIRR